MLMRVQRLPWAAVALVVATVSSCSGESLPDRILRLEEENIKLRSMIAEVQRTRAQLNQAGKQQDFVGSDTGADGDQPGASSASPTDRTSPVRPPPKSHPAPPRPPPSPPPPPHIKNDRTDALGGHRASAPDAVPVWAAASNAPATSVVGLREGHPPNEWHRRKLDADSSFPVALGGSHSCGLTGGALKCWGKNDRGQIGITSDTTQCSGVSFTPHPTSPPRHPSAPRPGCTYHRGSHRRCPSRAFDAHAVPAVRPTAQA